MNRANRFDYTKTKEPKYSYGKFTGNKNLWEKLIVLFRRKPPKRAPKPRPNMKTETITVIDSEFIPKTEKVTFAMLFDI